MFEEDKGFDVKNRIFYLMAIFVTGLLLYLFLFLIYQFKSLERRPAPREITFSAEQKISPKPEFALFNFAVLTKGLKADEAIKLNDERRDSLLSALLLLGQPKEEIRELGYNISTVSDTARGMKIQTILVRREYEVKTKNLDKVFEMIKKISEKGGALSSDVKFLPEEIEKLRNEVRFALISEVKSKATRIAKEVGIRLDEIVGVKEEIIPQEKGEEVLKITLTYLIR